MPTASASPSGTGSVRRATAGCIAALAMFAMAVSLSLALSGARPSAHAAAHPDTVVVHLAHAAAGVLIQTNVVSDHLRQIDLSAPDAVLLVATLLGLVLLIRCSVRVRRHGTAWMASRAPPSVLR
jgi:hypothetical protein